MDSGPAPEKAHPGMTDEEFVLISYVQGEHDMAKQKPASRAAARASAQKKSAAKPPAKSSSRKSLKTKARAAPAAKPRARAKQRIPITHYHDGDFVPNGLRAYAHYGDLGMP